MEGFYLLCGHLFADFVCQPDALAANKANEYPGPAPDPIFFTDATFEVALAHWEAKQKAWWVGNLACAVHCLIYTLAVWLCSFWWMPVWGLLVCFAAHYALDRYRLARKWMLLAGQEKFATGPLSPWSIVVVDNTFHLLTLALIAAACGRV